LGFALPFVGTIGLVAISIGTETLGATSVFDLVAAMGRWPLLIFGLLVGTWVAAPGVFASYHLLQDLRQVWPRVYHQRWMVATIVAVQLLIAASVRDGLFTATAWLAVVILVLLVVIYATGRSKRPVSNDSAISIETPG
jgi:predicted tellurium resistance membrane protein TerC